MSQYILHNGRVKEVHGQFSNMVLYKDNKEIKSRALVGTIFCDKLGNPLPDETQAELKGEEVIKAESLVKEDVQALTVKIGNNNPLPKQEESSVAPVEKTPQKHNLNRINTETEIRLVAADVSGLGVKTLRTIVENRPEGGYSGLEHLKELNGDRIPKNLKWSAMEAYLVFD